jgi:hypothetical protein
VEDLGGAEVLAAARAGRLEDLGGGTGTYIDSLSLLAAAWRGVGMRRSNHPIEGNQR